MLQQHVSLKSGERTMSYPSLKQAGMDDELMGHPYLSLQDVSTFLL